MKVIAMSQTAQIASHQTASPHAAAIAANAAALPQILNPHQAEERRQARRSPVIKSAKLIFGQSGAVHDCLVLDESSGGVMADLGVMMKVPDEVTVQFSGGASYLARRQWSNGSKVGLHFIGKQIISDETALRMKKIADILRAHGLMAAIGTLRAARFFDNVELRRVAEDVEAANARFEAALDGRLFV